MANKGTKGNGRVHPAEQTSMSAHDSSTASDSHHDGGGDIMQASEALLKEGLSKSKGVHWWWLTFGEPAIEAEYRKFRRLRGHVTVRAENVTKKGQGVGIVPAKLYYSSLNGPISLPTLFSLP